MYRDSLLATFRVVQLTTLFTLPPLCRFLSFSVIPLVKRAELRAYKREREREGGHNEGGGHETANKGGPREAILDHRHCRLSTAD